MSRTLDTRVAIALGSNLGDRHAHLDFAARRLAGILHDLRLSSRYDTEPVDAPQPQPLPRYLNAAATGTTRLDPVSLLRELQAIEAARGRERPYANAPRTLDLDLILFGDLVMRTGELTIPHPRFAARRFVLEPFAEIAPDLRDPISGLTMHVLLERLRFST